MTFNFTDVDIELSVAGSVGSTCRSSCARVEVAEEGSWESFTAESEVHHLTSSGTVMAPLELRTQQRVSWSSMHVSLWESVGAHPRKSCASGKLKDYFQLKAAPREGLNCELSSGQISSDWGYEFH